MRSTTSNSNPWLDRFDSALTDQEIGDRIALHAVPSARDLHASAPAEGAAELRRRLADVFVPSRQVLAVVRTLLSKARAHALHHYPDGRAYLRGVNASACPLYEVPATCVTGLAGCGKTEIAKALLRLLEPGPVVDPGSGYPPVTLEGMWHVAAKAEKSLRALLETPARGRLGNMRSMRSDANLCELAGRLAFRHGVCMLSADEMQFWTYSANASALVTSVLYRLKYIGLPLVFFANFSLCHRLLKRPQEDHHRLLAEPIVVRPDTPDDPSLMQLYEQYRLASNGALCSEPQEHVEKIEHYSAGVKRNRRDLLVLSYRIAREHGRTEVRSEDLDAAYFAPEFKTFREEAQELARPDGCRKRDRRDLWCPFELPLSVREARALEARDREDAKIAHEALLSSMTAAERNGLRELQEQHNSGLNVASLPAVRKKRRPAPTLEDLQAGTKLYMERLTSRTKKAPR